MRKRKPTHPGIILDEMYLQALDITLDDISDRLGISRNTLYRLRNGKISVTAGMALKLSKAFDTTPEFWLNLQNAFDLWEAAQEKSYSYVQPIVPIAAKCC
jgi:antitoxin HigA-1